MNGEDVVGVVVLHQRGSITVWQTKQKANVKIEKQ